MCMGRFQGFFKRIVESEADVHLSLSLIIIIIIKKIIVMTMSLFI